MLAKRIWRQTFKVSALFEHDLVELALRDAVAIVDDPGGLEASGFVELDEQLSHHGGQILDDVLTMLLHTHRGAVSAGVGVHATNNLNNEKWTPQLLNYPWYEFNQPQKPPQMFLSLNSYYSGVLLTAAMEGFFPSPAGGWVTSAPRKITGCWNTSGLQRQKKCQSFGPKQRCLFQMMISSSSYLPCGRRMLLTPPNLTLIFKHRLERVWGVVFWTFFTCTHCVAMPSTVSPTRFTSAAAQDKRMRIHLIKKKNSNFSLLLRCRGQRVPGSLTINRSLPR